MLVSNTFEEHVQLLNEVYRRLKEANLTLNFDNCSFCQSSLKYLGYVIDKGGLRTDPDKVTAVSEYPRPVTATQIKRFMGLVGWYRRFVPDFSSLSAPITALLHEERSPMPSNGLMKPPNSLRKSRND